MSRKHVLKRRSVLLALTTSGVGAGSYLAISNRVWSNNDNDTKETRITRTTIPEEDSIPIAKGEKLIVRQ